MADALRTTYWVPQMGSKFARSACGTKRSARAAARWEIAGVGKEPAAEMAPAAAIDFRNALRSMMVPPVRSCCRSGQIPCRNAACANQNGLDAPLGVLVDGIDNMACVQNVRQVVVPRKRQSGKTAGAQGTMAMDLIL